MHDRQRENTKVAEKVEKDEKWTKANLRLWLDKGQKAQNKTVPKAPVASGHKGKKKNHKIVIKSWKIKSLNKHYQAHVATNAKNSRMAKKNKKSEKMKGTRKIQKYKKLKKHSRIETSEVMAQTDQQRHCRTKQSSALCRLRELFHFIRQKMFLFLTSLLSSSQSENLLMKDLHLGDGVTDPCHWGSKNKRHMNSWQQLPINRKLTLSRQLRSQRCNYSSHDVCVWVCLQ